MWYFFSARLVTSSCIFSWVYCLNMGKLADFWKSDVAVSFLFFHEQVCLIIIYCLSFHESFIVLVHSFYQFVHLQMLAVRYLWNYWLHHNAVLWRRVSLKSLSLAGQLLVWTLCFISISLAFVSVSISEC